MRSSTLDRIWYSGAMAAIAVGVVGGTVLCAWDLRQQNVDHSYAVGYDEARRGWHDESCHRLVEQRYPRLHNPDLDMGAWLDGCLAAANDGPAPEVDWSTIGPPGPERPPGAPR